MIQASANWRLLALGAILVLGASSLVVVGEGEQAVIVRLGAPTRVLNPYQPGPYQSGPDQAGPDQAGAQGHSGAGLAWRVPFVDSVVRIDKRAHTLAIDNQTLMTADGQRLTIDAYVDYRVIDPWRMVRTVGSADRLAAQLRAPLTAALRQNLARQTMQALLGAHRGPKMEAVRDQLDRVVVPYGVRVIDVGLTQTGLPDGAPLDSAIARMQTQRDQQATAIRAQGQEAARLVQADAEARASKIYADSFGKDPAFYDFYRAMRSYEATFANPANRSGTRIVLSPESDYLRQFRDGGRGK